MFDQILDAIRGLYARREWTDVVELLLIGAGVYAVMHFLKGTRGARVLRGFALLLVGSTLLVSLVATAFDLERIRVLYPYFVAALFLIALVAFQPELRRALMRVGAASWFVGSAKEVDQAVDAVVDAVGYLSKNKIGAIIAFERTTEFSALAEAGCRLDADVSKELLTTIFWPGSALHDMGVIVSQGRIAAAAVQFPLTDSDDGLDPTMGSRHRAALGLSQESDALVVVVSEETGTISIAEGGKLERFPTADALGQALKVRLGQPPPAEEETVQ